ncbi:MAG: hypothetical protein ACR2FG_03510 [Marmoricola sp.]
MGSAAATEGLGAAFMAGLGTGVWSSYDELRETWEKWKDAVERSPAGSEISSDPR